MSWFDQNAPADPSLYNTANGVVATTSPKVPTVSGPQALASLGITGPFATVNSPVGQNTQAIAGVGSTVPMPGPMPPPGTLRLPNGNFQLAGGQITDPTGNIIGSAAPPPGPSGGAPTNPGTPTNINASDRNAVQQWVQQWAAANNRPDIGNNPGYWVDALINNPKPDGTVDTGYIAGQMSNTNSSGQEINPSGGSAGYMGPGGMGGLIAPFTGQFSAPSLNNTTDPGYLARLQMGTDAIQRSAAAKGTLNTVGTEKALDRYTQDYASNEYGNVYNRALGEFNLGYNIFEGNQGNAFNRLYDLTGLGLNAAGGAAGALGQNAGQLGNLYTGTGASLGNLATGNANSQANIGISQGNVGAANTIGQGNALAGALGGLTTPIYNNLSSWAANRGQPSTGSSGFVGPMPPAGYPYYTGTPYQSDTGTYPFGGYGAGVNG